MELTQDQKDALKELSKSRGFKVLEEIVKGMGEELFKQFETKDPTIETVQQDIMKSQMVLSGAKQLLGKVNGLTQEIKKKTL